MVLQTAQQLSSIQGLVDWYSDFVQDLTTKAEPLRAIEQEGAAFAWDAACQGAFEENKWAISDKLVLTLYDPNTTTFLTRGWGHGGSWSHF